MARPQCFVGALRHRYLINKDLMPPEPAWGAGGIDLWTWLMTPHAAVFSGVEGLGGFPIGTLLLMPNDIVAPYSEVGVCMWLCPKLGTVVLADFPDNFTRLDDGGGPIYLEPDVWHTFEMKVTVLYDPDTGSGPADIFIRPKAGREVGPLHLTVGSTTTTPPSGFRIWGGPLFAAPSEHPDWMLVDDVEFSTVDWVSEGGAVSFADDFETYPLGFPDVFEPSDPPGGWSSAEAPWDANLNFTTGTPDFVNTHIVDPLDGGNTVLRVNDKDGLLRKFVVDGVDQCAPPPPVPPVPPNPNPTPSTHGRHGNVLGCGIYEIQVLTRGGRHLVHTLPYSQIEWGRLLDDTSEAKLTIDGLAGRGDGCCSKLADIRPWEHELAVYRDGEQVWVGPIVKPAVANASDVATVLARDVTAWWDKRFLHKTHDYGVVDLAYLFAVFIDDAMEPDNTPGIHVTAVESQILGEHKVLQSDHRIAGAEIRSLSQIGVDWTTVCRNVIAGGVVVPLHDLPSMIDEHFVATPDVSLDGLSQENHVGVRGAGVGAAGDAVYGDASNAASQRRYGLLEGVTSQETANTGISAEVGAHTKLALVAEPVALIESGTLAYRSPFPIGTLVPGVAVPVRLRNSCYPVDSFFRIGAIAVTATASDGAVTETVTVSFMPLGTVFRRHHYPPRQILTPGSVSS